MVRKAENARERFGMAAMELFRLHGYAETTVPQIAASAGLTERTFFRYFGDKAEVLFWRSGELEAEILGLIREASSGEALDLVLDAMAAAGRFFDWNRTNVIARQAVVAAHPAFQERELSKMHSLTAGIAGVLENRGLPALSARMAAESGVAIWRVSIELWSQGQPPKTFQQHLRVCADESSVVFARLGGDVRVHRP